MDFHYNCNVLSTFSPGHLSQCFFIKIADRNWNSVTSRFYYKYRKKETFEIHEHEYDPEVDDTIKQIERKTSAIKKLSKRSH